MPSNERSKGMIDMIEILAYGALGALILFTSLVLWWFVRLAE